MRDLNKNINHFNEVIRLSLIALKEQQLLLDNQLIANERVNSVKRNMAFDYIRILSAKYSRGDDMFKDNSVDFLKKSGILLNSSWNKDHLDKIIKYENNTGVTYPLYYNFGYINITNLLSLCVLLEVSEKVYQNVINFIDLDKVNDILLEFMISSLIPIRQNNNPIGSQKFYDPNKEYSTLKIIVENSGEFIAEELLKRFLEKEWMKSFKGTPQYNEHESPYFIYSGYWCFPAAAIVKIMGLDDSSFRDNKYYPKDLVNL